MFKFKKKKWRILCISLIVLTVLIGVVSLWLWHEVGEIEERAQFFATRGKAAIALLGSLNAAFGAADEGALVACYDAEYTESESWSWWTDPTSTDSNPPAISIPDRDGIRVTAWTRNGNSKGRRNDVVQRILKLRRGMASLHESKMKLGSLVSLTETETTLTSVFIARGVSFGGESFEGHAKFDVRLGLDGDSWRIREQRLIWGETVSGDRTGFQDVTEEAGIDFLATPNPMFLESEWEPRTFGIIKYGPAGVAVADVDGDGWDDIFFANGGACRLYRNRGGGKFVDWTASSGLPTDLIGVNVGLFADFDNDGDRDLFLGRFTEPNRLYCNKGGGKFVDVTEDARVGIAHLKNFVTVASAGDYDGDGRVDLYVGRYLDPRINLPTTLFYTRNSEGNSLLRNLSEKDKLRFEEVTEAAGVRDGGLTLGVAWGDYDADGDADLYVANDFGRNGLYRNEGGGTFSDATAETGTLDFGFGMSAAFGDIDNDLDLDLYISNVHSSQRWYGQAITLHQYLITSIRQGTFLEDLPLYREILSFIGSDWHSYGDRMVKGNSLLVNDGAGRFTDVAESARANPFGWYWSSAMFDYDGDGWQDVYAVNGWITSHSKDDL